MTKIIAALDESSYLDKITKIGAALANESKSELVLLHIAKPHDGYAIENRDFSGAIGVDSKRELLDQLTELDEFHGHNEQDKGEKILKKATEIAKKENSIRVKTLHLRGMVAEEISNNSNDADLLIFGKRGESAEHHAKPNVTIPFKEKEEVNTKEIGHNLENIIRATKSPILVVTTNYNFPFKKLVFAYDDSESSKKLAGFLSKKEIFKGAQIHLILCDLRAEDSFKESDKLLNGAGFKVTSEIKDQSKVNEVVAEHIKNNPTDLIVAPAFVNSKIHNLILGSVTEKLISEARIPMLLMS